MPAPLSLTDALGHALTDKRIDILRQIGQGGSISQAARVVGVSYKAAWQALDTLTNLAGVPLVVRAVGGAGGGGALLTDAGAELLAAAQAMAQARGEVLSRWHAGTHTGPALARLVVRTSMRNQLLAVVQHVHLQGQIARVELDLVASAASGTPTSLRGETSDPEQPAHLRLSARITRESSELLGLQPGLLLQVLCKATAVRVERPPSTLQRVIEPTSLGAYRLPGKAVRVVRGDSGDEVSAELTSGQRLVGFAPSNSRLRVGSNVMMVLEDQALVLALAQR
ncbi:MAG: LysR family transcriptional regulator [Burkholderiaceae bacterium]|nr:LysR family transcriptional regulator [Burkholderiaceae bacterium]